MKKKIPCKKITPRNYKKCGFDHYYKLGKTRYKFTKDTEEGTEKVYNSNGKYEGEFD